MPPKKILVFGAAGFIGTYLVDELLHEGYDVVVSDISNVGREYYADKRVSYVNIDITEKRDFDRLESHNFDAVVHLAAWQPANVGEKNYDPKDYINVNVIGTLNILEFCREKGVERIIYASSHRNTQALWAANKAIREDDGRGIKYSGEYAMFSISESAAQDCIEHYGAQYGLRTIVFRLPPVYGYGPHTEIYKDGKPIKTGFQIFIEKAMACQPLEIWGDANVGRDIIYVKDVVSAFMKAVESATASGLFNITSGKYLTLREQAETIAKEFWGSSESPKIVERPDLPNGMDAFLYDNSKARRELGWCPKYSFADMLADYKAESESRKHEYLVNKRKQMFNQS